MEVQAQLEVLVHLGPLGQLEELVPLEHLERRVRLEHQGHPGCKDLPVTLEQLEDQVELEHQDLQALLEHLETLVPVVQLEQRVE